MRLGIAVATFLILTKWKVAEPIIIVLPGGLGVALRLAIDASNCERSRLFSPPGRLFSSDLRSISVNQRQNLKLPSSLALLQNSLAPHCSTTVAGNTRLRQRIICHKFCLLFVTFAPDHDHSSPNRALPAANRSWF
jgi:hypothetical protein